MLFDKLIWNEKDEKKEGFWHEEEEG